MGMGPMEKSMAEIAALHNCPHRLGESCPSMGLSIPSVNKVGSPEDH